PPPAPPPVPELLLDDALVLLLDDALVLLLDEEDDEEEEPEAPVPLTDAIEGRPEPLPQNPHSAVWPAASVPLKPTFLAVNCPLPGVTFTFHGAGFVDPLSATTTLQPVTALRPLTFTLAQ
ncbi:hypothetical protein BE15_02325, partial [Sorangium cellulosum]